MTTALCGSCNHFGDDFTVITEEDVYADLGECDHPDDLAYALESVGDVMCPVCGSTDVETGDAF